MSRDWIIKLEPIFQRVSESTCVRLAKDTHYDAQNFEFSKVLGNEIHRLDFQPMADGKILVTKNVDKYPLFPRFSGYAGG